MHMDHMNQMQVKTKEWYLDLIEAIYQERNVGYILQVPNKLNIFVCLYKLQFHLDIYC